MESLFHSLGDPKGVADHFPAESALQIGTHLIQGTPPHTHTYSWDLDIRSSGRNASWCQLARPPEGQAPIGDGPGAKEGAL